MSLEDKIAECIEKKQGDKEFALFYIEDYGWRADIGNPMADVIMLGEITGEHQSEWMPTSEGAVTDLLRMMETKNED